MNLTASIIAAGCGASSALATRWLSPLQGACDAYQINTPLRAAAFLAQIGVESARLTAVVENLNYSVSGLMATFQKYFTEDEAQQYANKPPMIANRVYANRMGNGDEASGDGWTFRGRGCIQITGRQNYTLCVIGSDLDLINHPELLEQPVNAALAAGWYWANANLNVPADASDLRTITLRINGGLNSYSQRLSLYGAAKKALGIA